jgi:hypothetical protein
MGTIKLDCAMQHDSSITAALSSEQESAFNFCVSHA